MTNAPPWYVGARELNGRSVPVVSFEGASADAADRLPADPHRRFSRVRRHAAIGYFGMLTQGFPQLVRVNADVLRPDPRAASPALTVICQGA